MCLGGFDREGHLAPGDVVALKENIRVDGERDIQTKVMTTGRAAAATGRGVTGEGRRRTAWRRRCRPAQALGKL